MNEKIYFKPNEFRKGIENLYEHGIQRGVYCGFEKLHEHYTMKMGGTTFVYSAPFTGKTEFWFEILINLSELYGYKHVIYSPESGDKENIIADLISKAARKPFYRQHEGYMDEKELYRYMDWVNEYFVIIDPKDKDISIEDFFTACDILEKDYQIKINTTLIDPFNELKHEFGADGRQDLYIENKLGLCRRNAIYHNRHNVIITHCADQDAVKSKNINGEEVWYYPPANPRRVAGGQAWFRKAMMMICMWRPPVDVIDPATGTPFIENEVHIIIQKYKPKGTGKKGLVKLYFDQQNNRYYELIGNQKRYAGKQGQGLTKQIIQPDIF